MEKIERIIVLVALLFFVPGGLQGAAPIYINGKGSAPYDNLFGKPDQKFIDQAKAKAVYNAILLGIQNQPEGLRSHFKSAALNLTLQDYIDKFIILETANKFEVIPNEREVIVLYTGQMDLTAMRDYLNSVPLSAMQNTPQLSDALVAVFFTVRESASKTVFDDERVTSNTTVSSSAKNIESQGDVQVTDTGVSQSETSLRQEKEEKKESKSGSTTSRIDDIQYELDDISKELFGDGLKARFTTKGIEGIFDGAMFESAEVLDEVYGEGASIRSRHWKAVTEDISNEEPDTQYLIVGTLDFSYPTKDALTGMPTYSGTVAGKVYKLRGPGKIPMAVGGLAPLEAKISAPSQQDAKKRVVAKLSELAADEIISFLNQKGIL